MKKKEALRLSKLLNRCAPGKQGWTIQRWEFRPDGGFISSNSITDADGTTYEFWIGCWRDDDPDNTYLNIFKKGNAFPVLEVNRIYDGQFPWRYKPSKQDGRNIERKKLFESAAGSLEVQIPVPETDEDVPSFLQTVFDYVNLRLASDDLSKAKAIPRHIKIKSGEDVSADGAEGERRLREHYRIERDPKIARAAKETALQKYGKLNCQVCGFDFNERYGTLGEGFIEAHHTIPLNTYKKQQTTKAKDLALVCSNCHRMIHRREEPFSVKELKNIIAKISK